MRTIAKILPSLAPAMLGVFLTTVGLIRPLRADSMLGALHLGIPVNAADARGRALGGATSTISGELFSFDNPARTVNFWRSGINGTISQDYRTLRTPQGEESLRSTEFMSLQAVFPAFEKFVISWGLHQDRDLTWEITDRQPLDFISGEAARRFYSTGNFYLSRLGVSRPLSRHLAVGMSIDWLIGKTDRERRVEYGTTGITDNIERFSYRYSCLRPTFGVLGSAKGISAGLAWTPGKTGDIDKIVQTQSGVRFQEDLKQDFPSILRLGASYRVVNRQVVSFDYEFQSWDGISVPGDSRVSSVNQRRWGVGYEIQPSAADVPRFYRRIPWRFGYSRTVYPFEVNGHPVEESFFAFGSGVYFGGNVGLLDVALEFGKRKVDASGYPEEGVTRLVVSLSAFERWISRPRRR